MKLFARLLTIFIITVVLSSLITIVGFLFNTLIDETTRASKEVASSLSVEPPNMTTWFNTPKYVVSGIEIGLIIGFVAMVIGVFMYSRRR